MEILIQLNAYQAISTLNQLQTRLGGLDASFKSSAGTINHSAMSFERWTQAAQKTVGAASPLSGGFTQIRNSLGGLNSQINTTAQALPKMTSAEQQAARRELGYRLSKMKLSMLLEQ